jgi:transposase-like protein
VKESGVKQKLRTTKDECPRCGSKNVVPIGGGAQNHHDPIEMLHECRETKCHEVYVKVSN